MSILEILQNNFSNSEICEKTNKIFIKNDLKSVLNYLKTEQCFDMLWSLYATDYTDYIELNYYLYSTVKKEYLLIGTNVTGNTETVIDIYESAYFDECEIYDLFGLNFTGNNNLKRLLMPSDWKGYPLLKNYEYKKEVLNE